MTIFPRLICLIACVLCFVSVDHNSFAQDANSNWQQFRGPTGNGVSTTAKPPVEWSGDSENLKWKTPIPGKGSSSPIVWEDKVYLMTAVDTGKTPSGEKEAAPPTTQSQGRPGGGRSRGRFGRGKPPTTINEFYLLCLNRDDGTIEWKTKLTETVPHEGKHSTNTFCSASPVTDGKHIYASFGSFGLFCVDMDGKLVWKRNFGKMSTRNSFGEGASPALFKNKLCVIWDHEGDSFIETMDATTGKTIWKKDRVEPTGWATPRIVEHGGGVQVIANATKVKSYDLADGSLLWECGGQTGNPIPTPIILDDFAICMTGFRNSACYAIPLDSRGDITDTDKIIWNTRDIGPYVATGVLYGGTLYGSKSSSAVLTAVDAKTGETIIETSRLDGIRAIYSSMVAADGHVFITGRSGKTVVLNHGNELNIAATNDLGEAVDATPALAGNQIFIRGENNLYCFED